MAAHYCLLIGTSTVVLLPAQVLVPKLGWNILFKRFVADVKRKKQQQNNTDKNYCIHNKWTLFIYLFIYLFLQLHSKALYTGFHWNIN